MILKTIDFQKTCSTILVAVNDNAANLELTTRNGFLYLNVTNKEYYVAVKFELENPEDFLAVVDAKLFLDLIAGITTDTFELKTKDNTVVIKAGKSSYKLPMIYENDHLMELPPIVLDNPTVEMGISNDILTSILNVNSKELLKVKNIDVNELQKLYYIDETGCFTFTTGSCLNEFTLEKPVKLLLNDRIVKLFKLFKTDVQFAYGHDVVGEDNVQSKVVMKNDNTYLAAITTSNDVLINKIKGPCDATKRFLANNYSHSVVLSVPALLAAINRLMNFTKNSVTKANMLSVPCGIHISGDDFDITDNLGNTENILVENGSVVNGDYNMTININDLKLVLDSCKVDHITLNCGDNRSVVVSRGAVKNLIPEMRRN